jgi:rhodanese-related sulfurtransferase
MIVQQFYLKCLAHAAYVVADDTTGEAAVVDPVTGDTLFAGDVGRPDLRASLGWWSAEELGKRLYHSVHEKLLALPDRTLVNPAHDAGSLCGKALGTETFSAIGEPRRVNYALQPMIERAPTALPLDEVLALQRDGAQLLDTREAGEFAAAHIKGSVNVGLGGPYATWAGSVLDPARPVVVIAADGAQLESEVRLGRIGFDNVTGHLAGGMAALADRPDLTATTIRVSPAVPRDAIASREVQAVDVRTPGERARAAIAGAIHMPLSRLATHAAELPTKPLLLFCAGGYRSSIAASLLESRGLAVRELAGGMTAWETAGLPTESAA